MVNSAKLKSFNSIQIPLLAINLIVRCYCAFYMIIPDCDETYNYWEPLNLLLRGFGKQTWEYSPDYAIRSYAYLIPYYVIGRVLKLVVGVTSSVPIFQFYFIRLLGLTGFTVFAEWKLFFTLREVMGTDLSIYYLLFSTFSPGMAHAGVALLPSTLAMQCATIASSYVLKSVGELNHKRFLSSSSNALFWFAVGGYLGWPFATALCLPFSAYVFISSLMDVKLLFKVIYRTLAFLLPLLSIAVTIDYWFYRKLDIVPLNIVLYNVFGSEGEGPEIFGIEPLSYYIFNLLINFNALFLFSVFGLVSNLLMFRRHARLRILITFILPSLIWLAIFGSQPHKEERFLYPIYTLLLCNAASFMVTLDKFIGYLFAMIWKKKSLAKILKNTTKAIICTSIILISSLRVLGLISNYGATMNIPYEVAKLPSTHKTVNVCVGREWYHFPNSFFLPDGYRLRFVKSGFSGLLPGDFKEGVPLWESSSTIPSDMNNKNLFSASKLTDFAECDYYIDNSEPVDAEAGEKLIIRSIGGVVTSEKGWTVKKCQKLINPAGHSSLLGRIFWVPSTLKKLLPCDIHYMDFCLSEREYYA